MFQFFLMALIIGLIVFLYFLISARIEEHRIRTIEGAKRLARGGEMSTSANKPDPADEFMDYLGLPREEGKLALWEAALDIMPPEFWGKLLETAEERSDN